MDLWASRHVASGLVALSVVEAQCHPARGPAAMSSSVRVVDEATAALVETMLRERAHAAAAAGEDVDIDLDQVIARAERAAGHQH